MVQTHLLIKNDLIHSISTKIHFFPWFRKCNNCLMHLASELLSHFFLYGKPGITEDTTHCRNICRSLRIQFSMLRDGHKLIDSKLFRSLACHRGR